METFHWTPHFETGLETVDTQHHRLVDLINRFGTLVGAGEVVDAAEVEAVYGELAAYSQYHFEEEGGLMERLGVDARHVQAHHDEHVSFLAAVGDVRREEGGSFVEGARPLLRFLIHWLAFHILGMDQHMARQIRAIQGGASPEAAFEAVRAEEDAARTPLLEALNGLFELLMARNSQLADMNRRLEEKVAARTRELTEANARLETLAMTDALTGLFNRRYALERLAAEIASARRHGDALSLVLLDADGFKAVNDTYGHDAGDAVIRALGAALKQGFRAGDLVCRMGGDEFLVLCPRTPLEAAFQVAERARASIAALRVPAGEGAWQGSLSAGVAALGPGAEDAESLLKAADLGVYEAKRLGRNRVVARAQA